MNFVNDVVYYSQKETIIYKKIFVVIKINDVL